MAPHSSTLAWKIPWMEGPGGLQSKGSLGVGHDWATSLYFFTFMHRRRQWQPTLAWKIPWKEGPGGLQSMGSHRVGHDWSDLAAAAASSKIGDVSHQSQARSVRITSILIFIKPSVLSDYLRSFTSSNENNYYLFPGGSDRKESACNAGDMGSIPGSGRFPGGGNGNPLWYSCLENAMHWLQSMGSWQRVQHAWVTNTFTFIVCCLCTRNCSKKFTCANWMNPHRKLSG